MVTLNVYAHLFEDDLERLYEGLDAKFSDRQTATDGLGRPQHLRRGPLRDRKQASDLGKHSARTEVRT